MLKEFKHSNFIFTCVFYSNNKDSSALKSLFFIQWNLSNPTHQGSGEMC
jgi:hypothetical protein